MRKIKLEETLYMVKEVSNDYVIAKKFDSEQMENAYVPDERLVGNIPPIRHMFLLFLKTDPVTGSYSYDTDGNKIIEYWSVFKGKKDRYYGNIKNYVESASTSFEKKMREIKMQPIDQMARMMDPFFSMKAILRARQAYLNVIDDTGDEDHLIAPEKFYQTHPFALCELNTRTYDYYAFDKVRHFADRYVSSFDSVPYARALITEVLKAEEKKGHVFSYYSDVLKWTVGKGKRLGEPISTDNVHKALKESFYISDVNGRKVVYSKYAYNDEKQCAEQLKRLRDTIVNDTYAEDAIAKAMDKKEETLGFTLHELQREAVQTAIKNQVAIITGGPGTGKSTILEVVVDVYHRLNPQGAVQLLAPTGKAAQRLDEIAEKTGVPKAKTLHRALHVNQAKTYGDDLTEDFIIVDESSMIDLHMMAMLLTHIKTGAKLLLVGDPNQLQPVGYGEAFGDMILSKKIPMTQITQVFRQSGDSAIPINAHKILNDDYDLIADDNDPSGAFCLTPDDTYFVDEYKDLPPERRTLEEVVDDWWCAKDFKISETIVLTAHRKSPQPGDLSVESINLAIQKRMNEAAEPEHKDRFLVVKHYDPDERKVVKRRFYYRDRFMFTKNMSFPNGISFQNGDTGAIDRVDIEKNAFTVVMDYPKNKAYSFSADSPLAKTMTLAYAMTVHKSQGSQYPLVIFACTNADAKMLNRNLVYTAITRAKERVYVDGSIEAFFQGCKTIKTHTRRSKLRYMF